MIQALFARNRWTLGLQGTIAILFGLLAIFWPIHTIGALVKIFGAFALIDGILTMTMAVMERNGKERWWMSFLKGLVGIAVGVITFFWPAITALVLLYLIAIWAFGIGIIEICFAILMYRPLREGWSVGLAGIAALLFGLVLVIHPGIGALTVIWLIGMYAVVYGVLQLTLALRHRRPEYVPA